MNFSWVVLAWIDPSLEVRIRNSDYFSVARNPGFLKPLGISSDRSYRPWFIKPGVEIWQELVRRINRETVGKAEGRSSTLKLKDDTYESAQTYNFNIRFYRPGTLCVEVRLEESTGSSPEDYFRLRDLKSHRSANEVVDALIGIISCGDIRNYPTLNSYSVKTAMRYPAPVGDEYFPDWKNKNRDLLVGLLINNSRYEKSSSELSDTIFNKNKELDVKYAKSAFSMISKQGVLTAYPERSGDLQDNLDREHRRRSGCWVWIRSSYPQARYSGGICVTSQARSQHGQHFFRINGFNQETTSFAAAPRLLNLRNRILQHRFDRDCSRCNRAPQRLRPAWRGDWLLA
jgi:hypothetical protein